MTTTIVASGLTKTFSVARARRGLAGAILGLVRREHVEVPALAGVSFAISGGEVVGYLGPNGAGKSTTLKILTGILVPTAGTATVAGRVPWQERVEHTRHIGVVFGHRPNLWWDLPVRESYHLLAAIYGVSPARLTANLDRFTALLELEPILDAPVRTLSLGQRMRADLAGALLHDPKVLFLDEPTVGLDVVAKDRIRRFVLAENARRGVTVLLTTHDLGDVERLCRRVMMIDHGRLLFDGPLAGLVSRFGGERELVVELAEECPDVSIPGATVTSREGRRVTYRFRQGDVSASDLIVALGARLPIADLTVREPSIEDTVRRIYEERLLSDGP